MSAKCFLKLYLSSVTMSCGMGWVWVTYTLAAIFPKDIWLFFILCGECCRMEVPKLLCQTCLITPHTYTGKHFLFAISAWETVKLHQCSIYQKHNFAHFWWCSPVCSFNDTWWGFLSACYAVSRAAGCWWSLCHICVVDYLTLVKYFALVFNDFHPCFSRLAL